VMDGHFVPNISLGPDVLKRLTLHSERPFDVHLMISPVDPYLQRFADAGATMLTVHVEAGPHIHRTLDAIRELGKQVGVTLNPGTPLSTLESVIGLVDMVLVMSVNPGFAGQKFIEDAVDRVKAIRAMAAGKPIRVEVDGGVTSDNAGRLAAAGADTLVAGSYVFKDGRETYAAKIAALRAAAEQGIIAGMNDIA